MYNQNTFHSANYRGNQPGHDNYLRSDSQQPSQSSFSRGQATAGFSQKFQPTGLVQSQYQNKQNQAGFSSSVGTQSFHTANYRGNQAGHDNYLRSDSQNPSQSASFGGVSQGISQSSIGQGVSQSFQSFGSQTSPQSFHTANYRGNQAGHDNYLRSDSQNPSQSGIRF